MNRHKWMRMCVASKARQTLLDVSCVESTRPETHAHSCQKRRGRLFEKKIGGRLAEVILCPTNEGGRICGQMHLHSSLHRTLQLVCFTSLRLFDSFSATKHSFAMGQYLKVILTGTGPVAAWEYGERQPLPTFPVGGKNRPANVSMCWRIATRCCFCVSLPHRYDQTWGADAALWDQFNFKCHRIYIKHVFNALSSLKTNKNVQNKILI